MGISIQGPTAINAIAVSGIRPVEKILLRVGKYTVRYLMTHPPPEF